MAMVVEIGYAQVAGRGREHIGAGVIDIIKVLWKTLKIVIT